MSTPSTTIILSNLSKDIALVVFCDVAEELASRLGVDKITLIREYSTLLKKPTPQK